MDAYKKLLPLAEEYGFRIERLGENDVLVDTNGVDLPVSLDIKGMISNALPRHVVTSYGNVYKAVAQPKMAQIVPDQRK